MVHILNSHKILKKNGKGIDTIKLFKQIFGTKSLFSHANSEVTTYRCACKVRMLIYYL